MSVQLETMLEQSDDTCGGRLRIAGTRITVHQIAALHKQGLAAQQVVENCPYITLAQVYAALAFYHANREEIDAELAGEDADFDRLKQEFRGQ